MKKSLLLGGAINAIQITDAAHNLGIEVGVVDYYDSSECKKLADYAYKKSMYSTSVPYVRLSWIVAMMGL